MFTGIVTDVGRIKALEARGDLRAVIATAYDAAAIEIGASIACSGVCLTVVDKGADWFAVDVSAATQAASTLGDWREGGAVNLERSLHVGDELGGHIVTGHVDGVGTVIEAAPEGDSRRLAIAVPKRLAGFIAAKGSIAVDGVSLTVNAVHDRPRDCLFEVNIIPHTQAVTSLRNVAPGTRVNVEIDILARYVARLRDMS
ncbi:MAG: riboflavin synthase [Alphaproteobacteria bacterium]|nr:MAG: riboflavin synthase [Alphaproteobacteria bacterium]